MDCKPTQKEPRTKAQRQLDKERTHVEEVNACLPNLRESPSFQLICAVHNTHKVTMDLLKPMGHKFSQAIKIRFPREAQRRKKCLCYWLDQNLDAFRKFIYSKEQDKDTEDVLGSFQDLSEFQDDVMFEFFGPTDEFFEPHVYSVSENLLNVP